ncbi:arrestin domain-containing protein 3-like [Penaeus japonicus]|uniref:arrestin domain-containing protein 3-like n=1 Tax=Penaeus japonicus TaxID=27405 RepID=UPI001C712179|nr:arrestin domain-containing protein 3-like [Penaeus japonicus]
MGFETFTVVLEPEQPVYFSGQVVQGYVRIANQSSVTCTKITVTAKGIAKVSWTEKRGKTSHSYCSSEEYFRETLTVWSEMDETFPAGDHRFPFAFEIPQDVPSSFESYIGKVRYQVKAVADKPWQLDESTKTLFSVNHLYDLNTDTMARSPILREREKSIRCCCAVWGPINLTVTAERKGYVAGENMVINGEIVNNSGSRIKYTEAKIVQKISYITSSKTKETCHTVQRVYRPQIESGSSDRWEDVPLPVPAVTTSHLMHCNIIDVEYYLVFEAKLGTCRTAKIEEDIIIGSIPLRGTIVAPERPLEVGGTVLASSVSQENSPMLGQPRQLPQRGHEEQGGDNPPPYHRIIMPEQYADIPPPSYESCMFNSGNQNTLSNGTNNDEVGFAPHYITYRGTNFQHYGQV